MLKYGQQLADEYHVLRYVSQSRLRRDGDDNVVGFLFTAFQLKEGESDLSVSWLEYFNGARAMQIADCVRANRASIHVGASSAFAIANVGKLKEVAQTQVNGKAIKVIFTPSANNPAHTSIKHLPRDEMALLDRLAVEVFDELVTNASIP